MKCRNCGYIDSKVVDSRPTEDGARIRRRRECLSCNERFTTYESIEMIPLVVVKRDNSRQPFDREKLLSRLMRACGKRPVSTQTLEAVISEIEDYFESRLVKEVNSTHLGELVMEKLKKVDQVAYIRFASVYKEFKDIDSFMEELKGLKGE